MLLTEVEDPAVTRRPSVVQSPRRWQFDETDGGRDSILQPWLRRRSAGLDAQIPWAARLRCGDLLTRR